jgi:hypothetical protein
MIVTSFALGRSIGFCERPSNDPVFDGRRFLGIEGYARPGLNVHFANSFSDETRQRPVAALCFVVE